MCGERGGNAHLGDEALLHDKVSHVKRAVGAPAEADEALAGVWVDEAVLGEEMRKILRDLRKLGRVVDLFLRMRDAWGAVRRWTRTQRESVRTGERWGRGVLTCVMPVRAVQNSESFGRQVGRTKLLNSSTVSSVLACPFFCLSVHLRRQTGHS